MSITHLQSIYSPWYLILCIAIGAIYAYLLYSKKSVWDNKTNWLLATIRGVLVTILCILLIRPFFKFIETTFEKPTLVVLIDNSESLTISKTEKELQDLIKKLLEKTDKLTNKLDIQFKTIDNQKISSPDSVSFKLPFSNLEQGIRKVESDLEGKNLAAILLLSDGIYNQGVNPDYLEVNSTIYAIGIGDTTIKKDIILKDLKFNPIAYKGNKFIIKAEIQANGFMGAEIAILLKENDNILQRKTIKSNKNNQLLATDFIIDADKKGLKKYTVIVETQKEEYSTLNNRKEAFVEIIENKEKILIVSASPHPDIKALKSALETNQNYEISTLLIGIDEYKRDKYDLVILYQIPNFQNIGNDLLKEFSAQNQSVWYIFGNLTNASLMPLNAGFSLKQRIRQTDQAQSNINNDFTRFSVEKDWNNSFKNHPPLSLPFGDIILGQGFDILMYQQINKIPTQKPLLALKNDGNNSTGVLFGEGIWMWRMNEYKETEKTEVFDKLIVKIAQFLSSKEDKRKFRMYPKEREWYSFDNIVFESEIFNDLYEPLYNQQINLTIISENGKNIQFSFTNLPGLNSLDIGTLKAGIYRYKASAVINGKVEESAGEFTVKELQLEMINTTADFQLLRNLAEKTNGIAVSENQLDKLFDIINATNYLPKAYSDEDLKELIHIKWIFVFLLLLISTEWFIRKYKGGY